MTGCWSCFLTGSKSLGLAPFFNFLSLKDNSIKQINYFELWVAPENEACINNSMKGGKGNPWLWTCNPSEVHCLLFYFGEQIHSINTNGEDRKMRLQYPRVAGRYFWSHPSIWRQMDSIPGTTCPMSLGKEFLLFLLKLLSGKDIMGPLSCIFKRRMGPTSLDTSSGGQGGALV